MPGIGKNTIFLAVLMDLIEIRDKEHVITLLPGNYPVRVR